MTGAAGGTGTGSGLTKGDELREETHKPLEAVFAFLARGGVPVPCVSSRAGELDLAAARVEGLSREDGAAEAAAGLALSADFALLHVAEPSTADTRPGLGDVHRLAASAGVAAGGAMGLNLDGTSLLRSAGAAAALFFSDGASGRRRAPSAAATAAAAFLRSPFTCIGVALMELRATRRGQTTRIYHKKRRHDPTTGIICRDRSTH